MRWIVTGTGLVPADQYRRPATHRSTLAAPHLMTDTMPPTMSMLDGKLYDSKSRLRQTYRAAGVTEVGNDVPTAPPPMKRPRREDIKAAVGKAFSKAGLGA
jgi:hypothetical protein